MRFSILQMKESEILLENLMHKGSAGKKTVLKYISCDRQRGLYNLYRSLSAFIRNLERPKG